MQLFKWSLLAALVLGVSAPVGAQQKFPFRLNWTLYGEHAPFFVARDKGFYRGGGPGGRDPGRQRLDHRSRSSSPTRPARWPTSTPPP